MLFHLKILLNFIFQIVIIIKWWTFSRIRVANKCKNILSTLWAILHARDIYMSLWYLKQVFKIIKKSIKNLQQVHKVIRSCHGLSKKLSNSWLYISKLREYINIWDVFRRNCSTHELVSNIYCVSSNHWARR